MINVLIVEDDPMVAEFNRRYLAQVEGFALMAIARSTADALAVIEQQEIDLILLDIFMPGVNGLELLSQIRQLGRSIDVIVVSAACDSESIQTALRFGAVDYLIKPFEFERLNAALAAYRDRVRLIKEQETLSQSELDQRILRKDQLVNFELPKGLDLNTLKIVWESIQISNEESFTTDEMAKRVGISRVSMRKYLNYLRELEILIVEVTYGSIGRPVYKYRCINPGNNSPKRYMEV
jgi:CitB family two-component system response regulator MalR